MQIEINKLKPKYMSDSEVLGSDIYLQTQVVFEKGKKYLIRAKSGHGKTSLLNFIYGNNVNYDGTITYNEKFVNLFSLRQNKISYLFQDLCLFPELTAIENVRLKNLLTEYKTENELSAMLDNVLAPEKKNQPTRTLSLGQQQRVAIVRALCQPFDFLLLDEPFSHIDHENSLNVARMIDAEIERQGAGLIVTALDDTDAFVFDKVFNL